MFDASLLDNDDTDLDRIQTERSAQRAVADLERIVGVLVQRWLGARRRTHPAMKSVLSWRALLEIEEQAFSDLGFQSRHDKTIIDGFLRLSDSRLHGANIDEAVDWRRDDERLPAVYLIMRAMLEAEAAND
jgi:hypothetical protein